MLGFLTLVLLIIWYLIPYYHLCILHLQVYDCYWWFSCSHCWHWKYWLTFFIQVTICISCSYTFQRFISIHKPTRDQNGIVKNLLLILFFRTLPWVIRLELLKKKKILSKNIVLPSLNWVLLFYLTNLASQKMSWTSSILYNYLYVYMFVLTTLCWVF